MQSKGERRGEEMQKLMEDESKRSRREAREDKKGRDANTREGGGDNEHWRSLRRRKGET